MKMKELVERVKQPAADKIPKGYKDAATWANEIGVSHPHMNRYLAKLIAEGLVVKKMFRQEGRTHKTPHYREKGAAE